MKNLNLVGWAIHLAKPVMAAKAAIHAFPAARHLWIRFISGEAKVSGRFSEEKLRKRLLLLGACGAATTPCPQDKNFLRSFFLKKRPLGLSEI